MEDALRRELGTAVLRPTGYLGGGCISQGQSYDTDRGRVYVKSNSKAEARRMFEGEMASLEAILKTQTIKVPKPIKVIDLPGGNTLFVMEHLEMRGLNRHSAKLGTQLADLHLHNQQLGEKLKKEESTVGKGQGQMEVQFVDQFGFHTVTCCGYLPQVNDWQNDWVTFFAKQRIQPQMDMIEKNSGDREARELWAQLQLKIPSLFCDVEIVPALLHGDLWGGNVAEDDSGPIIFDPASFYGHSDSCRQQLKQGMEKGMNSSLLKAGCWWTLKEKLLQFYKARKMFEGEMASLEAIQKTNIVRVPQPIKIIDLPGGGAMFVMEYLKMKHLNKYSSKLGEQIADLHLYNQKLGEKLRKEGNTIGKGAGHSESQYVDKFGFHTATCCGYIPQVNEWQSDWPSFFIRHRLQAQLDLIEKDYGDREARELWSQLKLKIPEMFCDVEIVPALLHGDLWAGNVAEDDSGPIIFDPASFYGHSEFELAIAGMFGGFSSSFFSAYHSKIPKAPGFEKRNKLYQLFNYINHWNHFGTGYRGSTLNVMRKLLK
ncbi:fructosamine-3-kinase isoform 2-T2 [Morphnus guianensis]